jgi:serine/threonine protein kinase
MEATQAPLAGRYRFLGACEASGSAWQWRGVDERTGRPVAIGRVSASVAPSFAAMRQERHPHLVTVLDVISDLDPAELPDHDPLLTGTALVVVEHLRGRTLHQQLRRGAPIAPFKAVAWSLRLASALEFLHSRGLVHGAVSSRSVVVEPSGRMIAPVLSCFVAPPLAHYCTPERLGGAAATPRDDVRAWCVLLYTMLTGSAAFDGSSFDELLAQMRSGHTRPLSEFGLNEPVLELAISRGLHSSFRARGVSLAHLTAVLDAWERGTQPPPLDPSVPWRWPAPAAPVAAPAGVCCAAALVFDESGLSDEEATPSVDHAARSAAAHASSPVSSAPTSPAAASSTALHPRSAVSSALATQSPIVTTRPRRYRWPLLIGAAILVAGVAGLLALNLPGRARSDDPDVSHPATVQQAPLNAPSAGRVASASPAQQRDLCIRSYFAADAFPGRPALEFVCGDGDFQALSRKLHRLAEPERDREGADAGQEPQVVDGGVLVVRGVAPQAKSLGWYELLATAIVRQQCCYQASAVRLPRTRGPCLQLESVVRSIAVAFQQVADITPATKDFEEAISCLFATGFERLYIYEQPPDDQNRTAFQKFLQRAAERDARRSGSVRQ